MIGGPPNVRMQGVRKNAVPQVQNEGAPRTTLAVTPAEFFAVGFNDEQGRFQRMVVVRVDGVVYVPPGSIEWAAGLKKAADWLTNDINRMAGQRIETPELDPTTLPADAVDVLGNQQEKGEEEVGGNASSTPA